MTPEEWPIWTPHERGRTPALRAGRDRLPTVRRDLFLDADFRLTEQERALMTAMLQRLVADVASEIQVSLPSDWLPANDDIEGLIERTSKAGLLDIEEMLELFLRRADEERVVYALNAISRQPASDLIQPFVSDMDGDVAAAAMAVLIARGRRRDRYGRTIVELDDLSPEGARALVFAVAAGLREGLPIHVPASGAERRLFDAAIVLLDRQDGRRALDELLSHLVSLLADSGRLDDALIGRAISAGDLSFLAHALGRRANVHHSSSFGELMSCDSRRVLMVLRLAGCARSVAAQLIASCGDLIGIASHAQTLDAFDSWTAEQVDAARSWLQLDPGFQSALRCVGNGNGHRTH